MQLIATLTPDSYDSGVSMGNFKKDAGVRHTDSLTELVVTDTHIGPFAIRDIARNDDLPRRSIGQWVDIHKFLCLISAHNREYKFYFLPTWVTPDRLDGASPKSVVEMWTRDILGDKIFIGSSEEPYTFGAVSVVWKRNKSEREAWTGDTKFEIYSPRISNNRYNNGDKYYHRASNDIKKALKFCRTSIRAPLPEERHLPELVQVQQQQYNAVKFREAKQRNMTNKISDYNNRDQVVAELVNMRRYVNDGSVGEYTFLDDQLSENLAELVRENSEILEAINYKLEQSAVYYRVHMFEHDGRMYYSRTGIVVKERTAGDPKFHHVYADTPDAAYRPVESMSDEVHKAVSMLNFYDKEDDWVLGLGVMVTKNRVYYIPTTLDAVVKEVT